ncbi:phytanoyl-CoA dioxygenase family protein [Ktedonospora formicarum]|uniref:Phytanoyl-CoA dioxygenase n=1 Tax=Ktedonospora formicarum TaxID=2778364 RepID=A0A8J3I6C2_9CHLR|nr:phytanoyl-CoA dioxygenase family protein [Ktedonospora formicarum]GHO46683.1 phytanoyl-CoA dioxygenase [Ktedonospora formicarum]
MMIKNARTLDFPLISNGYPIAATQQDTGWLEPTKPAAPLAQLHKRYQEHGYLWLKGILDREAVMAFRSRFFEAFRSTGLLAEESDPVEGLDSGQEVDREQVHRIWMEAVRWPEYEAFCYSPQIVRFYESFLGGDIQLLKRKIIRYTRPGDIHCTPGHYDLIYLRAGTDHVYSSWIPLGDIPVEMGGLVYLEHSDTLGRQMEAEFSKLNASLSYEERISAYNKNMTEGGWVGKDLAALATKIGGRWLLADYEAGDMVVHSPYMIHGSTENRDPLGRMRLSTDIRYQRQSDLSDPRWNNHYYVGDKL